MQRYNPKDIEPKWQDRWEADKIYQASEDPSKPKKYILEYFPYPSGAAMHVGHVRNYTIGDVMARFARMQGFNVLHPMGWDAFGLPAENFAIKNQISPRVAIDQNTRRFKEQLIQMGFSYDWSREIDSTDPRYYKWTQWFFLLLYKKGLAYQKESPQWWCPVDKTVLANEQVEAGLCWRCGNRVEKKLLKQWFFRITDYADRLAADLDNVDWSDSIKNMQRNWIGRSKGAQVDFKIADNVHTAQPNFLILHGFTGRADKNFIPWLKDTLESQGYTVQTPQMPNTDTPVESEQVSHVLENCKINENTVIIGHSLGSAVAMKVIQKLNHPIRRLVLLASVVETAYRPADYVRPFIDTFDLTYDYEDIRRKCHEITVISDTREANVREKYLRYLTEKLNAEFVEITAERDHVTGNVEPALLPVLQPQITIFTTRPDTLYGATFMVLSPEHPLINKITTKEQQAAVDKYRTESQAKSEVERQETNREKTGVFTGAYALNPANNEKIPVWIADYVLMGYGTGAIMAVPGHDERDYAFARKFGLPVKFVVEPTFGQAQGDDVQSEKIYAILRNPKTQEVVVLNWGPRQKNYGGNMLIGGSVEDGESHREAAEREIYEETGYKNFTFVRESEFRGHGYFYSNTKHKNFHASGKGMVYDLIDEERDGGNLDDGEKEKFTVTWQPIDKVATMLDDGTHEAMYRYLMLDECYHGEGTMINSGQYDGLTSSDARERIVADLEQQGSAKEVTNYKIRDWLISRQRYWGAPIPMIHCPKDGVVAVPEDQLPVRLPELEKFEPSGDGRSPLANVPEFVNVECPTCGGPAERETDTMDGFACSSWYFLRFADPHNDQVPFDAGKAKFWLPVDDYIGGAEHAVMHLLYARMWTKVMYDDGIIDFDEPFSKLRNHGMILAPDGSKMSKSKGNTIEPGVLIDQGYGADSVRIMELFIGPWNQTAAWSVEGMGGAFRFLQRIWTLVQEYLDVVDTTASSDDSGELTRALHKATKKVGDDIGQMSFNTAIATLMEFVNELYRIKAADKYTAGNWHDVIQTLLRLIAPFAPHIAEELWQQLGQQGSIHAVDWPGYDEKYLAADSMTIVIQVNGKLRGQLTLPAEVDESMVVAAAQANDKVQPYLHDTTVRKTIYVPGKLVNFVI